MRSNRYLQLALLLALILLVLACRTAETLAELRPPPPTSRPRVTRTATRRATRAALESVQDRTPTAVVAVPDDQPPPPQANEPPQEEPTNEPVIVPPTRRPVVQQSPPQPPANTPIPEPTTPSYAYRVRDSTCGPNVRTWIEGYVYEGSVGQNDLIVRISQGPDGEPDPNEDYRTGTDTRKGKGYYFHNINIGAPHGGTWYLWVMDPATGQRISEIAIVKTDSERIEDSGNSAGSCQSAKVNFTSQPLPTPRPPTRTPPPDDPDPDPTDDNLNDSDS